MKITFILRAANLSGGNRVVATYAKKLSERGHDVTLVSPALPHQGLRQRARALLKGEIGRPRGSHVERMGLDYRVLDTDRPVRDADVPDADVVIAGWWETAYWVAALSPAKGRKFYFVQHHEVHDHLPKEISRGTYFLPLEKITVASWLVDIMATEYGDQNVALVPNSVDTALFETPAREKNAVPTVGFMYSPAHFKGADVVRAVIEHLRDRMPGVEVVAFGRNRPNRGVPLPERTHLHLKPEQRSIPRIYAATDVWLMPSRSEGFGLPVLEAMACRCPVVATRTGCAPDVIEDGINGYVADVGDADAMAEALEHVLRLEGRAWQRMSDAAYATAHAYSWDDACDRFEQAIGAPHKAARG